MTADSLDVALMAAESLELARRLYKLFVELRTRTLATDRPNYYRDVWPPILELLDGSPTLDAVHAALLFRDRLVADEGHHHAGAFMYALAARPAAGDDDTTAEDAARLSEQSLREVWDNPDDAEYDDVEGGDDV